MARFFSRTALGVAMLVALVGAVWAAPSVFPTGLTVLNTPLTQSGPVIYTHGGQTFAVGVGGNILWTWDSPVPDTTLVYTKPLQNGNLLARLGGTTQDSLIEFDVDGNLVWAYADAEGRRLHHDHERLANGNTLILCSRDITVPSISPLELVDDCLIEVSPAGAVVWEWQTAQHFSQLNLSVEAQGLIEASGGDWAHANAASVIPENPTGDERFRAGNIIISYRHINMVIVVDRATGNIVWVSDNLTIGQHHSHMINPLVPGGSNFMIFDNGFGGTINNPGPEPAREYSRVVEMNPLDMSTVWEYDATLSGSPRWTFFSHFVSSAERMPNGNTLIGEGSNGRIFEVTPSGEIVWEYVNPVFTIRGGDETNRIYRAHKAWFWN